MQDLYKDRSKVFVILFLFILSAYIYKVGSLQLMDDHYEQKAINNALNKITLYPARSILYDRNGKVIVSNSAMYDLLVFPKEAKSINPSFLCQVLKIDTSDYYKRLNDALQKSKKRQKNNSFNKSAIFFSDLSIQQYTVIRENLFRLKGFYIEPKTDRNYTITGGAHALGYLGEAAESLIKEDAYYQPGDLVGITGIEKYYEQIFRGLKGIKTVWQDRTYVERGIVNNEAFNFPAQAGPNVTCGLDVELQKYAEQLLSGKRGSIVAIEPSSGEVLTFVNKPDYNPNELIGQERGAEFRRMLIDPKKPLYNRAVKGVYPPGSTVKTVLALIGLQEGVLVPETKHGCSHGYHLGSITVGCHPHGGPLDVVGSLRISCNSYYCQVFRDIIDNPKYNNVKIGYEQLEKHWRSFGLGAPTGIDLLGESSGNIPSVKQLNRRHGDRWKSSMIISLGIGQGEILLTPLQLANVTCILANRGYYYAPHLIKQITGYLDASWIKKFKTRHYTTVDPIHFETVIEGMSQVTKGGGTASGTGVGDIEICAKTGTAQNSHGRDHSLYIAFAPRINPRIAIAVIIENGGFGATWAAPIANLLIEKYLKPNDAPINPGMRDRMLKAVLEQQ